MDLTSEQQFSNICRICAEPSNALTSLFNSRRKGTLLSEMVLVCAAIEIDVNDGRPSNICVKCIPNLNSAYELRCLAQSSEEKFQKILYGDSDNVDVVVQLKDEFPIEQAGQRRKKKKKVKSNKGDDDTFSYECYKCHQSLKSSAALRKHMKQHNDGTPHECKVCGMFLSTVQFDQHLCRGSEIQCEYCLEKFVATNSILFHLDECHKNQQSLRKCTGCSKLYPMKALLEWHLVQHNDMEKPWTCHICQRGFRAKYLLQKHRYTHNSARPHLCSECGMGFKTQSTLRSHVIRHSAVKPVACSQCEKRFYDKADLRKHMDVHSNVKYICDLCNAVLGSKRSLGEHKRHIHRNADEQTCDLCGMKFRTLYNLKRHFLTHTGEKPHKCSYCSKAFAQSGDLNKHMRSHIGENTYQCSTCMKSFRLQIDLRRHSYEHFQDGASSKSHVETNTNIP